MKRLIVGALMLASFGASASSIKCAAMAADTYYKNIIKKDEFLTSMRKIQDNRRIVESLGIGQLEHYCEIGLTNKNINVFDVIESAHDKASSGGIGAEMVNDFAQAAGKMYEYGKSIK